MELNNAATQNHTHIAQAQAKIATPTPCDCAFHTHDSDELHNHAHAASGSTIEHSVNGDLLIDHNCSSHCQHSSPHNISSADTTSLFGFELNDYPNQDYTASKEAVSSNIKKHLSVANHVPVEAALKALELKNNERLKSRTLDQGTRNRLTRRTKDFQGIRTFFSSNANFKLIGFIGWGDGCLKTDLQAHQSTSAVDGFIYLDEKETPHYQRIGSALELFTSQSTEPHDHGESTSSGHTHEHDHHHVQIATDGGADLNISNYTAATKQNQHPVSAYEVDCFQGFEHFDPKLINSITPLFKFDTWLHSLPQEGSVHKFIGSHLNGSLSKLREMHGFIHAIHDLDPLFPVSEATHHFDFPKDQDQDQNIESKLKRIEEKLHELLLEYQKVAQKKLGEIAKYKLDELNALIGKLSD